MSDKILEIKDAHVKYGNIEALKGVNVSIDYGEIVCLIGANGAGKSTLLKTITGLEPLAAGIVNFEGRPIRITGQEGGRNLPTEKIIALGISMAPEGVGFFPK